MKVDGRVSSHLSIEYKNSADIIHFFATSIGVLVCSSLIPNDLSFSSFPIVFLLLLLLIAFLLTLTNVKTNFTPIIV